MGHERSGGPSLPITHGFVREFKAANHEHLGKVAKAEFVAQTPQDNQEYDVCWGREVIVRSSSSLVEGAAATSATKNRIAGGGLPGKLGSCGRSAVRTIHQYSLKRQLGPGKDNR